jgi:hypothetical protein
LFGPAYADANTTHFVGLECLQHGADPTVTGISGARPHANGTNREVNIIMDKDALARAEAQA